ncbi:MAG: WD40 repeat domain-containing protein [Treponemataceae bacterium]|nr:WD40 repeat domain-containing protein [Treponemataceae bacterium]
MKKLLSVLFFIFIVFNLFADVHVSSQPHFGQINDMEMTEDSLFTVGQDGYVINWRTDGTGEHYQISDLEIKMVAKNPKNNNIAIYETDGYSINRISVWDWSTQKKIFAKRVPNSVSSLQYTEKGSYLMVGTTSEEGIYFLDQKGDVISKIKDPIEMVTLALSSQSEKSCILYTPMGYIRYINLLTREKKAELTIEQSLEQTVLFSNDLLFAGVKNNMIYVYNSVTGNLQTRIQAKKPFLATSREDNSLYFLDFDGSNYSLKMVSAEYADITARPVILKYFTTENNSEITAVTKSADMLYAACKDGSINYIDLTPSTDICLMTEGSKKIYSQIFDIDSYDDIFYFLTENSIFTSSYTTKYIEPITINNGYTNLITKDETSLILWSKGKNLPIVLTSAENSWIRKTLYAPTKSLQNVKLINNKLVIIEGSNSVKIYDFDTSSIKEVFNGTGIQDALLFSNNSLYVAKTASTTPKSPLIQVDIQTLETVALPVTGEVSFGLSTGTEGGNVFYGVLYSSENKQTQIYAFSPATKQFSAIMTWNEEDTKAFTWFNNGILYTNIGRDQIYGINIRTRKGFVYTRFAALPVKTTGNNNLLLVLNKDGSVSWYNAKNNTMYSNWYITLSGEWVSF